MIRIGGASWLCLTGLFVVMDREMREFCETFENSYGIYVPTLEKKGA